jgi:hypothetical protein
MDNRGNFPSFNENEKIVNDFENAKKAHDNMEQGGGVYRNDKEDGVPYTKLSPENTPEYRAIIMKDLKNAFDLIPSHYTKRLDEDQKSRALNNFFEEHLSELLKLSSEVMNKEEDDRSSKYAVMSKNGGSYSDSYYDTNLINHAKKEETSFAKSVEEIVSLLVIPEESPYANYDDLKFSTIIYGESELLEVKFINYMYRFEFDW